MKGSTQPKVGLDGHDSTFQELQEALTLDDKVSSAFQSPNKQRGVVLTASHLLLLCDYRPA